MPETDKKFAVQLFPHSILPLCKNNNLCRILSEFHACSYFKSRSAAEE